MRAKYPLRGSRCAKLNCGGNCCSQVWQWWWWWIWWQKNLSYWTNTIISDWFLSHGMFVMMMTIMSEQGTLLIISQIYFHLLRQRSIHNVIKTIWIWFYQASLSEMIIKPSIRGVAWGTPRRQLESLPLSSMGDRYTQRQMVESQKKQGRKQTLWFFVVRLP